MPFLPGELHHNYRHGHCPGSQPSPTHRSWIAMKSRCDDESGDKYSLYGGRGIRYCEAWADFSVFLRDMGERPEGCTLDRIDPDGNYEPGNCRWATSKQQALNRRGSVYVDFNGFHVPIRELAEAYGVPTTTIYRRHRQGYTGGDLVTRSNMNRRRVGARCPTSKLTEKHVAEIKWKLASGCSVGRIAKEYGVASSTISSLKSGKTWGHVIAAEIVVQS